MKKIRLITLIGALLLLMSVSLSAKPAIRLTTVNYPPYTIGVAGHKASGGLELEIVNEISNRLSSAKMELFIFPFKRALRYAKTGEYDGIWLVFKTKEREAFLEYSIPVRSSRASFWYLKSRYPNGIAWQNLDDLLPYRIGMVSGYKINRKLLDARDTGIPLKLDFTSSIDLNYKKLIAGRVDIAVFFDTVANALAKNNKHLNLIARSQKPVEVVSFYIGISKKSHAVQLLPQINRIIEELSAEGFIEKTLNK